MFRYYHMHIAHFSEIALPLTELTKMRHANAFKLNAEQSAAFQCLKDSLVEATERYVPRYDRSFIIRCDASEKAVAASLSQIDDRNVERPVAFAFEGGLESY